MSWEWLFLRLCVRFVIQVLRSKDACFISVLESTLTLVTKLYGTLELEWMRAKLKRKRWPEPTSYISDILSSEQKQSRSVIKTNTYINNSAYQRNSLEIPERLNPRGMRKIAWLLLSLATEYLYPGSPCVQLSRQTPNKRRTKLQGPQTQLDRRQKSEHTARHDAPAYKPPSSRGSDATSSGQILQIGLRSTESVVLTVTTLTNPSALGCTWMILFIVHLVLAICSSLISIKVPIFTLGDFFLHLPNCCRWYRYSRDYSKTISQTVD